MRFDLIICQEVFEHVAKPFAGARALRLLLAPNGLVFFTSPFAMHYHLVPTDYFRYSIDGSRGLLAMAAVGQAQPQETA